MRAGVIQSSYVPWRGYFDLIDSVDVFVLFDDVAFGSKGSWRHRNQLKFDGTLKWLTVPVKSRRDMPIDQVAIDDSDPWQRRHRSLIRESLGEAPYFDDALSLWEEGIGAADGRLAGLNAALIRGVCAYLGITTRIVDARDYGAQGAKTARLIELLKKLGADDYLSGPTARSYLDEPLLRQNGIRLEFKSYEFEPYPQQGGPFLGAVSVLDLIANTGPSARGHLKSRVPSLAAAA